MNQVEDYFATMTTDEKAVFPAIASYAYSLGYIARKVL